MRTISRGRENPQSTKQQGRGGPVPTGNLCVEADPILTQLQDKHEEPHWTHTLKWLLPPTEPLGSVPFSVQWSLGWQSQVGAQSSLCFPCWPCPPPAPPACPSHASRATISSSLSTSVHRSYESHLPDCTQREVHSDESLFPSNGRINKIHLCFIG